MVFIYIMYMYMSIAVENRTERINVLVTPSEKAKIEQMARRDRIRVSDYVRNRVLASYPEGEELEQIKSLAEVVGGVAMRLNDKLDTGLGELAKTQNAISVLRGEAHELGN